VLCNYHAAFPILATPIVRDVSLQRSGLCKVQCTRAVVLLHHRPRPVPAHRSRGGWTDAAGHVVTGRPDVCSGQRTITSVAVGKADAGRLAMEFV
jgi:hypothetical protein